ncbi:hypothetical protein GCM10010272_67320 [Streptomyces lateritius]|nr:hypothetical protein GCM10010272_67320 [Streptomyces lateritius]
MFAVGTLWGPAAHDTSGQLPRLTGPAAQRGGRLVGIVLRQLLCPGRCDVSRAAAGAERRR